MDVFFFLCFFFITTFFSHHHHLSIIVHHQHHHHHIYCWFFLPPTCYRHHQLNTSQTLLSKMDMLLPRHEDHSSHGGAASSSASSHDDSSSSMAMVFYTSSTTPLFSSSWAPHSSGTYAGTCIFLICLAMIGRFLFALKTLMEQRWLSAARARRYVVVAGQTASPLATDTERSSVDTDDFKTGTLISANGVEEKIRVVRSAAGPPVMPWRFSVDLPRAGLLAAIMGVGYLLYVQSLSLHNSLSVIYISIQRHDN